MQQNVKRNITDKIKINKVEITYKICEINKHKNKVHKLTLKIVENMKICFHSNVEEKILHHQGNKL